MRGPFWILFLKKQDKIKIRGFTLLEMVIVTGLLGVLLVSATGLLSGGLRAQRNAGEIHLLLQNAHFAMDAMSRTIRVSPVNPVQTGQQDIAVRDPDETQEIKYYIDSGIVKEDVRIPPGDPTQNISDLTSANVAVDRLNFIITHPLPDQPQITILLGMRSVSAPSLRVDLQTTVSLRAIAFE